MLGDGVVDTTGLEDGLAFGVVVALTVELGDALGVGVGVGVFDVVAFGVGDSLL